MALLEDILGSVVNKAGAGDSGGDDSGGGSGGAMMSMLLPVVIGMLGKGGLSNILGKMKGQGLSAEADSWVSGDENLPISPDQAKEVVGADQVSEIASKIGLPEDEAAGILADALPQVVDKVSPEGSLPDATEIDSAIGAPQS